MANERSLANKLSNPKYTDTNKVHRCDRCNFVSLIRHGLVRHLRNSHYNMRLCKWCNFSGYKKEVELHHNACHSNELFLYTIYCKFCDYSTIYTSALSQHVNFTHDRLGHTNYIWLPLKYESPEPVRININAYENSYQNAIESCQYCDFTIFKDERCQNTILNLHVMSKHDLLQTHECNQCEFTCLNKSSLSRHKSKAHFNIVMKKCAKCPFTADSKTVNKHMIKEHKCNPYTETKYCNMCTFSSDNYFRLQRHINMIHNELCTCKYYLTCTFTARNEKEIERHIKRSHEEDVKATTCMHCGYCATRASDLQTHIKQVHDKIKDNTCDHCAFCCATKGDLKKHIRKIHGDFTTCIECNMKFANSYVLREHVLEYHEHSIPCNLCAFSTNSPYKLKIHQWEEHQACICFSCGYSGFNIDDLTKHALSAHNSLPNVKELCSECSFSAYHSFDMKIHIQQEHKHPENMEIQKIWLS